MGASPHDLELGFSDERDRREHDVPDDPPVVLGHQRHHGLRPLAQRVDEIRLSRCFERFRIDGAHRGAIDFRFSADHHKRVGLLRHTAQVSTDAKLTHKRYGTISNAAKRLIRQNATIMATMSASRTRISTAARAPRCQAKNNHDQSALAASCAPKRVSAALFGPGERHTSHAATPISAYSTVHTGPNTPAGGAQAGLLS